MQIKYKIKNYKKLPPYNPSDVVKKAFNLEKFYFHKHD